MIEIEAVVDWETAIEIMKVLGHLGQIVTTEQTLGLGWAPKASEDRVKP